MRRYETILIAHVDLSEDELSKLIDRYEAIVKGQKGVPVKIERWGKRKLAYLIRKQSRGFYILIDYAGAGSVVNELERNLKIDDKVLKFMTVLRAEAVDPEALQKEIAEASQKKVETPAPAPEKAPAAVATEEQSAGETEAAQEAPEKPEDETKGEKQP